MIGISMGDANGVGPEIVLRAFWQYMLSGDYCVIGDYAVLDKNNKLLDLRVPLRTMEDIHDIQPDFLNIYDMHILSEEDITIGKISQKAGYAALQYVKESTGLALKGELEAIVTLPINKEAVRLSEANFSGHTAYIAELCGTTNYTMMLVTPNLIVTHISTHVSLRDAVEIIKKDRVYNVIRLTHEAVRKLRPQVRIAVAGLNPHAGENGAFGDEEIDEIAPAVRLAQEHGMDISGPLPPDSVFYQAVNGQFDAVVCMYHDQGHIPIKLLGFEEGVNVTIGLPIIRTSVDHGTAYDIAYKGIASLKSFKNAYALAQTLLQHN